MTIQNHIKKKQNKNNQINKTPSIPSNISQHPPPQININITPQFIQEIPKEMHQGVPMYPYYNANNKWY